MTPTPHRVVVAGGGVAGIEALLALRAQPAFGAANVFNWNDSSEVEAVGGLLRDLEEGYSHRLAIVVPPGPGWPLPAYELALLISSDARGMGMTPRADHRDARAGAAGDLRLTRSRGRQRRAEPSRHPRRARRLRRARRRPAARNRHAPSGRRLEVDRVLALPRLRGRAPRGVPADPDGFVTVDAHGRVAGVHRVWAAGDGIAFPVKFGGLAPSRPTRPPLTSPRTLARPSSTRRSARSCAENC
jgi:sulfide:quinone oxidoreductase